jgi:hypothetical protein
VATLIVPPNWQLQTLGSGIPSKNERDKGAFRWTGHFPWWDEGDISPGADKIESARTAASVKAGRTAARNAGRLDGRGRVRATLGVVAIARYQLADVVGICAATIVTRQGRDPRTGERGPVARLRDRA